MPSADHHNGMSCNCGTIYQKGKTGREELLDLLERSYYGE